ncbi:MAG: nucleoside hydrolase [Actinomycetes bacterium]
MRVHLDTDLGGDPDDLAALAMLLGWPDVELTGVTTTIDPGGTRAGFAHHALVLAGRADVPVVAGAEVSWTTGEPAHPFTDERYWPADVSPMPSTEAAAVDLLAASVESGATVVAVGPQTNLARLEQTRPGTLARATVVVMGGWVRPLGADLPPWGAERDFNVQWDTRAADLVFRGAGDLTMVTLADTLRTPLRERDLPRLEAAGRLGSLLARQAVAYAADKDHASLGRAHEGLPDDLLIFLHDPLVCAVALGWAGCPTGEQRLSPTLTGGVLSFRADKAGREVRVASGVDGAAFARRWIEAVETLT